MTPPVNSSWTDICTKADSPVDALLPPAHLCLRDYVKYSQHFDIVLQSGNKVALQTIALEDTTIKIGPARKTSYKGKMARRSKRSRRKDNQDRSESFH